MLRRSEIFIGTTEKIASSTVGAKSGGFPQTRQLIARVKPGEALPALNGENDGNVNLGGTRHECRSYGAYRNVDIDTYKYFAATAEHELGSSNVTHSSLACVCMSRAVFWIFPLLSPPSSYV